MVTSLRQLTFNLYFDRVSARIPVFHSLPKFACSSCRFWVWLNVLWCDYGRLDMLVSSTCISNLFMYLVHCLIRIAVVARFSGGITESHCWEISHTSLHSQQLFSSHFRLFFLPLFLSKLQNNTHPCEYGNLLIMVSLNYLKHSNCLECGQIATTTQILNFVRVCVCVRVCVSFFFIIVLWTFVWNKLHDGDDSTSWHIRPP